MLRQYEAGVEERDREKVNLEPTVIRKGEVERELRDNEKLANKLSVRPSFPRPLSNAELELMRDNHRRPCSKTRSRSASMLSHLSISTTRSSLRTRPRSPRCSVKSTTSLPSSTCVLCRHFPLPLPLPTNTSLARFVSHSSAPSKLRPSAPAPKWRRSARRPS